MFCVISDVVKMRFSAIVIFGIHDLCNVEFSDVAVVVIPDFRKLRFHKLSIFEIRECWNVRCLLCWIIHCHRICVYKNTHIYTEREAYALGNRKLDC